MAGLGGTSGIWSPERKKPDGFAFVIHPRDLGDVSRKYPIARFLPSPILSRWTRIWPPLIAGSISGVRSFESGVEIPGWIVICPLTPQQMLANRKLAIARIRSAIALARSRGAVLVGLGGLLPAVSGSASIRRNGEVSLTTGRALTSVVMTMYAHECVRLAGLNLAGLLVAVVGAAGAVGSATATLLAEDGVRRFLLFETTRGRRRLEKVASRLRERWPAIEVRLATELDELRTAALVVTATNDPDALIKSPYIAPGTIILDDAQPSDVDGEVLRRSDVVTISAGVARMPGIRTPFFRGVFAAPQETFSCLAEVATLAVHGVRTDFALGVPTAQETASIRQMAHSLGITLGLFQNAVRTYAPRDLAAIAAIR